MFRWCAIVIVLGCSGRPAPAPGPAARPVDAGGLVEAAPPADAAPAPDAAVDAAIDAGVIDDAAALVGMAQAWLDAAAAWDRPIAAKGTVFGRDAGERETYLERAAAIVEAARGFGVEVGALERAIAGAPERSLAAVDREVVKVLGAMRAELDWAAGADVVSGRACVIARVDVARAVVGLGRRVDAIEAESERRTHGTRRTWDDPKQLMAEKDHAELGMGLEMWRAWLDDDAMVELATPGTEPVTRPPAAPGDDGELEPELRLLNRAIARAIAACAR